jgi:methionyl-tRNA synthetase
MNTFIGGAWPYANGSLHLGHVTALLPGDILARYYRLKGENVLYVSGSDCNGTPIAIRAKQENVTPTAIADRYHNEFAKCFSELGFTYDLYTRTDEPFHHEEVQQIFLKLLDKHFIYKKEVEQTFCETCVQFLPDRYVEGTCPNCSNPARGDQCDYCSSLLDPVELIDKVCKLCGKEPIVKETEHYYFALTKFQKPLEELIDQAKSNDAWRENAIHLTERYLKEGLRDRAATRDLEIGVPVPLKGFEGKKIYVWIEAVSGYLTASKKWGKDYSKDWRPFWNEDAKAYYIHGKDNIPFHSIIWPAILHGLGDLKLPEHIVSSEYLTIEKQKLSTSRNWAIWVPDILESYHPDSIRYFLTINGPEKRDADFSWREFIYSHNSELLGAFGNLINRTFKFVEKTYSGKLLKTDIDPIVQAEIVKLYEVVGQLIEAGEFKRAIEEVFTLVRKANKYFDEKQPWVTVKEDVEKCTQTLFTCTVIIANLSNLLEPFLPFSSKAIRDMVSVEKRWGYVGLDTLQLGRVEPLFERIDIEKIEEERQKLGR